MLSVVFIVTVALVALILLVRRAWWRTRAAQLPQGDIPVGTFRRVPAKWGGITSALSPSSSFEINK
jgi:hypothetical protein